MAKLSKDEENLLKKLQAKMDAPDEPSIGKTLNVSVDLGDPKQVSMAQKLGLFGSLFSDDDEGDGEEDGSDADETPVRKGYFGS